METSKSVEDAGAFFDKSGFTGNLMSTLVNGFLEYAQYELNFSPKSVFKYQDSLKWFIRDIGDKDISELTVHDFVHLKKMMIQRGVGQSRIASVIFATKSFLNYCNNFLKLQTLDPKQIRPAYSDLTRPPIMI